jgi:hypothetical protein
MSFDEVIGTDQRRTVAVTAAYIPVCNKKHYKEIGLLSGLTKVNQTVHNTSATTSTSRFLNFKSSEK